jgi:hypothetical protein
VISPFIHAQLSQPQDGVAIGGKGWVSTAHALDHAYGVQHRRPTVVQRVVFAWSRWRSSS